MARVVEKTAIVPVFGQKQWVTGSLDNVLAIQLSKSQEPTLSMRPHEIFQDPTTL